MSTSYRERLDIYAANIEEIKNLIKKNIINTMACWANGKDIAKQTFHIIGEAGVGKTASMQQLTEELTKETGKPFGRIKIQSPVLSRDDLLCPFPVIKEKKFQMLLSDFIPVDPDSYGIYVIDEMSRGDHNLQQLMWQIMNEQMVHTYAFPKGWFVVCLDNPDDEGYSMNYIDDAAGLRRSCHLFCDVSVPVFLAYARKMEFHPTVIDFIESNPDKIYDYEAKKLSRVFANPASWEKVSNILWGYETMESGIQKNLNDIELIVSGNLNASMSRYFMDFVSDHTKSINPEDILYNYDKIRDKITKMTKDINNPRLAGTATSFVTWLAQTRPPIETLTNQNFQNVIAYLRDLPMDIVGMFFASEMELHNSDQDAFYYLIDFNSELRKDELFISEIEKPNEEITREALLRQDKENNKS